MIRSLYILLFIISSPVFLHAQKYEKLYEKAKEEYAKGKNGKALNSLHKMLEIHPHHVEARLLKIEINQNLKNEVALCWDLNILREYGCKEADNIPCSNCPDLIRRNQEVAINPDDYVKTEIAEEEAVYPGGLDAINKHLVSTLRYPVDCLENAISGKVLMHFIVERDGSISNISIERGIINGRSLEMEAHKAIVHLKRFSSPAKQFGKPVRQEMTLPIVFKLQ
jgi:TonB family protein